MVKSDDQVSGPAALLDIFGQLSLNDVVLIALLLWLSYAASDRFGRALRRRARSRTRAAVRCERDDARQIRARAEAIPAAASLRLAARSAQDVLMTLSFRPAPVLTREDLRLLPIFEAFVRARGQREHVLSDVALADLVRPERTDRARSAGVAAALRGVRLDLVVVDARGCAVAAVRYAGTQAPDKDPAPCPAQAVLDKAGIPLLTLRPGDDAAHIRAQLDAVLPEPEPELIRPASGARVIGGLRRLS